MSLAWKGAVRQNAITDRRQPRLDTYLAAVVVFITGLGLLMIYSVTRVPLLRDAQPTTISMERQLIFVTAGLILMVLVSRIDYREIRNYLLFAYPIMLVSLLVVFLFDPVKGAQRWVPISSYQIQPAEFAKLVVMVCIAAILAPRIEEAQVSWQRIGAVMGVAMLPAVMIFVQPDLGSAMVFPFVALLMLFAAGIGWRRLSVLLFSAVGIVGALFRLGLLREYQFDRIRVLFDPDLDPQGIGYTLQQSKLAIGSGQLWGRGLFEGSQTNLSYIPEQESDFIFTAVGEQFGFIGSLILLLAYLLLVWRVLLIAGSARDRFGSLLAVGVAGMLIVHVFINVGMTVGLTPVTGLPLPLMSQGGSSYLTVTVAIGLVMAIGLRRSPTPGDPWFG